jgi:hypothetical protein
MSANLILAILLLICTLLALIRLGRPLGLSYSRPQMLDRAYWDAPARPHDRTGRGSEPVSMLAGRRTRI